jgi:hypothetical protein
VECRASSEPGEYRLSSGPEPEPVTVTVAGTIHSSETTSVVHLEVETLDLDDVALDVAASADDAAQQLPRMDGARQR